jgi:signal transduction histidine kinase
LFRLMLNLTRNAAQAISADRTEAPDVVPEIAMAAWRNAPATVVRLSDNGPGLPKAARDHLFEAFSGSARSGGTGLGLTIAREIAQSHGGDLKLLETGPGKTVFEVRLPG